MISCETRLLHLASGTKANVVLFLLNSGLTSRQHKKLCKLVEEYDKFFYSSGKFEMLKSSGSNRYNTYRNDVFINAAQQCVLHLLEDGNADFAKKSIIAAKYLDDIKERQAQDKRQHVRDKSLVQYIEEYYYGYRKAKHFDFYFALAQDTITFLKMYKKVLAAHADEISIIMNGHDKHNASGNYVNKGAATQLYEAILNNEWPKNTLPHMDTPDNCRIDSVVDVSTNTVSAPAVSKKSKKASSSAKKVTAEKEVVG